MGPLEAIKTGFAKSFQFKGRASRSEFWWFAPFALGSALIIVWVILPLAITLTWYASWTAAFFILMPFWSAGARRLQDTGEIGTDIFLPAGLFFGFPIVAAILVAIGAAIHGLAAFLLFLFVAIPLVGFGIFTAFVSLGPTIGQLIVPSETNTNRFGPNPNEVSQ